MLCLYLNRLVSQSWYTLNGITQKHKLRGSWTSYTAPIAKGLLRTWCCWVKQDTDSKKFYSEPDAIEYGKTLVAKGSIQSLTWLSTTDSISKGLYSEHDAVKYNKDSKPSMTSFLVLNHERVRYRNGHLKSDNNHWCDHLAKHNINHLRDASTLRLQKLDDSLAKEPINTHAICAVWTLAQKADLQSIAKHNYKHLSSNRKRSYCSVFI